MSSESTPYRPFGRPEREAIIAKAVAAIREGRYRDIPDDKEVFDAARIQYMRGLRSAKGTWEKDRGAWEVLYGEIEKKWKQAMEKKSAKPKPVETATVEPSLRPDIMDEETFEALFGGHMPTLEKLEIGEPEVTIPTEELEEIKLKVGDAVSAKIKLPIEGSEREVIIFGRVIKPYLEKGGETKTVIKYGTGFSSQEKEVAIQNRYIRNGLIMMDSDLVIPASLGESLAENVERTTGINPRKKLAIMGHQGDFRAIGPGENSTIYEPTIIVISEEALRRGPKPEDEITVFGSDILVQPA